MGNEFANRDSTVKITCPIRIQVEKAPDLPAIITPGDIITYRHLDALITETTEYLKRNHVGRGTRVAIVGQNSYRYIALLVALWRLGAVAVLFSFRFPQKYIKELVTKLETQFVVCDAWDTTNGVPTDTSNDPGEAIPAMTIIPWNDIPGIKNGTGKTDKIGNSATASDCIIDLDREATILLTSGSSDREKAMLHTYGNYYYNALGSNENIILQPGDSWLLSLPLFHVGGLGILFRCFAAGAAVVVPDVGESIEAAIKIYRITHASLVSTQLMRLINSEPGDRSNDNPETNREDSPYKSIKALLLGGSAFPGVLIRNALDMKLPIRTTYGLSETASQVTTTAENDPPEKCFTSGKVLKYRQVKIDENSEICVRGETLFKGYIENSGIYRPLKQGGWFQTGDLGQMDNRGYLTVTGRKDNMFISGGENIIPEELEQILVELPFIQQALVVPFPSEIYGFRPAAFLKTTGTGLSQQEKGQLFTELEQRLPKFKIPDVFYRWPDQLKQTGIKVKRPQFKELLKTPEQLTLL